MKLEASELLVQTQQSVTFGKFNHLDSSLQEVKWRQGLFSFIYINLRNFSFNSTKSSHMYCIWCHILLKAIICEEFVQQESFSLLPQMRETDDYILHSVFCHEVYNLNYSLLQTLSVKSWVLSLILQTVVTFGGLRTMNHFGKMITYCWQIRSWMGRTP